ncbi:MAG TPA: DUF934 domain-containing protein [Steroidobacteraceae bacterium]|jgi:uncharacterized protein (DUF934 family)|nr:DUF934 domain-containing protein [Steroidobacteraceae bacterium]
MPRRLLRDGRFVDDEWSYLGETEEPAAPLILTLSQWQSERRRWDSRDRRLGVVLQPAHRIELLTPDISRFELVALEFSGPSEGRGYSQARMLREHWRFGGELRATGYVRRDQLFFMARCGFNSFELPETDIEYAQAALRTFSKAYQPSNDGGLTLKPRHRWQDIPASA